MRVTLLCVGRMKAGADKDLFDRYIERSRKAGRGIGITEVDCLEIPESRLNQPSERKSEEASAILKRVDPSGRLIVLDENGKNLPSFEFSQKIQVWRDEGTRSLALAIGGADGHGAELMRKADLKLALGAMTWPHQLARILIAEQIYRATTILSGHPYHRV